MNRALAVLTAGALITLLLGGLGAAQRVPAVLAAAVFAVLAVAVFPVVRRRGRLGWSLAYVAVQAPLAVVAFAHDEGAGSTLLLVVLVSQCVLVRLPVPLIAVLIALSPLVHVGMAPQDWLREGTGTLVAVLFGAVITELLLREQRTRQELTEAHEQLRDYAAQAERLATAQERNRLARDIHDGLGHSLTVVQMQVQAARAVLPTDPGKADEVLGKAQEQAGSALAEVRRSVGALREPRPVPPLPDALAALAAETSAAGVPTRVSVSGTERELSEEAREALFRAAQEGLTNVRKHASAGAAEIVVEYADDVVRLAVRDDGVGTPGTIDGPAAGFGLVGLRERAARLGGRLDLAAAPGGGVTLTMEVPG